LPATRQAGESALGTTNVRRVAMKRFVLTILAIGTLSLPAVAANCAKDYKDFWSNLDREKFAKLSADQIADLSRTALRGFDACTAGDERFTAENFFKRLDSEAMAKASDIFKSGDFDLVGRPLGHRRSTSPARSSTAASSPTSPTAA
jgi:hypothetical protein